MKCACGCGQEMTGRGVSTPDGLVKRTCITRYRATHTPRVKLDVSSFTPGQEVGWHRGVNKNRVGSVKAVVVESRHTGIVHIRVNVGGQLLDRYVKTEVLSPWSGDA